MADPWEALLASPRPTLMIPLPWLVNLDASSLASPLDGLAVNQD